MPTGGINLQNIQAYLPAGAVAVGIGTALVNTKQKVTEEYLSELQTKAAKFASKVNHSS